MAELPRTADDIDAAWLTEALQARHPGASVREVAVLERHEVTNSHARLAISYSDAAGAPPTMFCKLLPPPPRRDQIIQTTMGKREALFYSTLAHELRFRTPAVHVALLDDDGSFVLLLEDLVASQCAVSDGTWGIPVDSAARALEDLAELHVRYEDSSVRAAQVEWIPRPTTGSRYGADLLRYGLDHHRHRLSDDFAAISELYIDRMEDLSRLWREGPLTVIHGDPHIGNLFLDGGRTGFLDWGIINVNTPMRDVSYFLNMAMDVAVRRAHQVELLRHYLDARRALGGAPIGFDDAWAAHRIHAAYCVPASCQVVTFPENASARRKVFADGFLARAEGALEDLEALAAIRAALG